MTDPVSDMLTRIRNAIAVGQSTVDLPYSKAKEEVAKVLVGNGFLNDAKVDSSGKFKILTIVISVGAEAAKITSIRKLSRPGQRLYVKASKIPKVRHGRG